MTDECPACGFIAVEDDGPGYNVYDFGRKATLIQGEPSERNPAHVQLDEAQFTGHYIRRTPKTD